MNAQSLTKIATTIKLSAALVPTLSATASANVVFDFFETQISCRSNDCELPGKQPIAELVLPGPDSSGSASWPTGHPIFPNDPPPTWSGDPFIFASVGGLQISSANLEGYDRLKNYSLSWSETDNVLTSFSGNFLTTFFDLELGLERGHIGTDGPYAGCTINSDCTFEGFWVDPPDNRPQLIAAPEPWMLGSFLAIIGLAGWRRRRGYRR